jgi:hypothetical protein
MTTLQQLLGIAFLTTAPLIHAQELDKAEVRIPYSELKQLLARAELIEKPVAKPPVPQPELLSVRLKLSIENGSPLIDATFRTVGFGNELALVPLISGGLTVEKQDPQNAVILIANNSLCFATDQAGPHTIQLRLLPIISAQGFTFSLPPCPSTIFESGDLPADQSMILQSGNHEQTVSSGRILPLPPAGGALTIRLLDSRETRESTRPPEPSTWTWQHQALVTPADGDLTYQMLSRSSAAGGSGVEALLPMPPDAQDIMVSGEDLVSHSKVRGDDRSLALLLVWKTRGILDRQVGISYRMPLRPLDPTWHLQAPGDENTRTRFIIADSPLLSYAADGLNGPLTSQGLPTALAEALRGGTCHQLEGTTNADLTVTFLPVAATAEGVVSNAEWTLRIEPDGAMLATGTMTIDHKSPLGFEFDTPEGMKLLACEVGGKGVSPVDLGGGRLMVTLTPHGENSRLSCTFTGRITALDPVEGTMKLSLPKLPLFMHSLLWTLDLPAGYQAETHGNLMRVSTTSGQPSRISLRKNLCRDERPEIQVFYQRSDINR